MPEARRVSAVTFRCRTCFSSSFRSFARRERLFPVGGTARQPA